MGTKKGLSTEVNLKLMFGNLFVRGRFPVAFHNRSVYIGDMPGVPKPLFVLLVNDQNCNRGQRINS